MKALALRIMHELKLIKSWIFTSTIFLANANKTFAQITLLLLSGDSVNFFNFKLAFILSVRGSHITLDGLTRVAHFLYVSHSRRLYDTPHNMHTIVLKRLNLASLFANSFNPLAVHNNENITYYTRSHNVWQKYRIWPDVRELRSFAELSNCRSCINFSDLNGLK